MEILGIGPSELVFIFIIALIILGPKDMQKAGKTIGKWLRNVVTSDGWKIFQQTSRELKTLPNRLMREANEELGQLGNELNKTSSPSSRNEAVDSSWMQKPNIPQRSQPVPTTPPENRIVPPVVEQKIQESDQEKDA